jgi:hypothetical protein
LCRVRSHTLALTLAAMSRFRPARTRTGRTLASGHMIPRAAYKGQARQNALQSTMEHSRHICGRNAAARVRAGEERRRKAYPYTRACFLSCLSCPSMFNAPLVRGPDAGGDDYIACPRSGGREGRRLADSLSRISRKRAARCRPSVGLMSTAMGSSPMSAVRLVSISMLLRWLRAFGPSDLRTFRPSHVRTPPP